MIGQILGGYEIREQIASGGMATVYKAFDPALGRFVAIKTLPQQYTDNELFRSRFEREARAITLLEHSHILPVFKHGEERGIVYLAMRYVEGGTLKRWLSDRQISYTLTFKIINQIASALDFAHRQGILHRDIKPSNVLIDTTENTYLTDFGLAKILEDSATGLTGTDFLGTPRYMSPEQCTDVREITAASDQYSLGVILYQMVTGQTPYNVDSPKAIIQKHLVRAPYQVPSDLRLDLSPNAEAVILKALAYEPEDRFYTCSDMIRAFGKAIEAQDAVSYQNVTSKHAFYRDRPQPTLQQARNSASPPPANVYRPVWSEEDRYQTLATPTRPTHSNWWVWLALAVVIIVMGIGTFLLLSTRDNNNPSVSRPSATAFVPSTTPELPTRTIAPTQTLLPTPTTIPIVLPSITPSATEPVESGCEGYIVQSGDTLFRIALNQNVTLEALLALNGLSQNSILEVGQTLLLPSQSCQAILPPTSITDIPTTTLTTTPTASATSAATFTPTATFSPTASPTRTNTSTATPTFTHTPSPTPTLMTVPINLDSIYMTATALGAPLDQTVKISVGNAGNAQQETVTITNVAGSREITGWKLVDQDNNVLVFPVMRMASNASLTIYTRTGLNTNVALYWNQTEAVWQNGETLTLLDANDNIIAILVVGAE